MLSPSNRTHHIDERFDSDVSITALSNQLFVRVVAKEKRFTNVDFKYSIFDHCYFRKCTFDSCDFTGARFEGTNLSGSTFPCCKFDYTTFERTLVDDDILDSACDQHENLRMKFARTLRANFQQLGDTSSVNRAIRVELEATEVHWRKAWSSSDQYYRAKYAGWRRLTSFLEWASFKVLDFIWGNGESATKLLRAVGFVFITMCLIDVFAYKDAALVSSYAQAVAEVPQIFLGVVVPPHYRSGYLTIIALIRLLSIGLFISILIRRFSRR